MSAGPKPLRQAMYVASEIDRSWLQNEQRKLYARSNEKPEYVFCKLWGLVTDLHNLRVAVARVARNRGQRTAGVDGITVRKVIARGVDAFVDGIRRELRSGSYRPDPVRRVLIPKAGQPGKYRALGIPTVKDRVVQAAMKNILEPIFEADFYPVSYGFRPSKSAHEAVEHLRKLLRPQTADRRSPYQWAIEGDIKACFDNISHHGLMERIRRRVGDAKVNRLVVAFLKAGILSEAQYTRTETGTPQGGILSPLLANIALSAIEERYERWVWPRRNPTFLIDAAATNRRAQCNRCTDRDRGIVVCFPVRYADDFIILIGAPRGQEHRAREIALQEKAAIATMLGGRLGLELSEAKTLITSVMQPMRFLGHSIRVRRHPSRRKMVSTAVIPKARSQHLRERIKALFRRSSLGAPLSDRLRLLNPLLRGWGNFYRHAWGASHVFSGIDHFVWWTIFRWIRKKHHGVTMKVLRKRYGWSKPGRRSLKWKDGDVRLYELAAVRVGPFMARHYRARPHPYSAFTSMESPMHSERCTSGSGEGARKPAGDDHR